MASQLYQEKREPTYSEKLNAGMRKGRELIDEFERESQENQALKSQGVDLAGIRDPKMRQEAFKQAAKSQSQLNLIKQLGLTDEFGQGQESQQNQQQPTINPETGEVDIGEVRVPRMIPEKKIQAMALVNPAVADKMQKHNDNIEARIRHHENLQHKKDVFNASQDPEKLREKQLAGAQATSDIKYNQELQSAHKQHELKTQTLDKLEKLNNKGVTGKPYEKLLEKFGLVNLTSEGRREFAADVKNLITDIRSILGAQFSQFEFQTILNAYPSADFSQEANRAIINNLKEFQDIRHQEFQISKDIKKENGGKIPEDYQSKVNDRLQEYAQSKLPDIKENTRKILSEEYGIPSGSTLMFDPQGEPMNVPDELIGQLLEQGASLP
jgi:hypothetical protein